MDTQQERGLADHAETLKAISSAADSAEYAASQATEAARHTSRRAVGARIDGLYRSDRAVMLGLVNDAVDAITTAENALRTARAAIEQLPA